MNELLPAFLPWLVGGGVVGLYYLANWIADRLDDRR
jgi:hypothetical protein